MQAALRHHTAAQHRPAVTLTSGAHRRCPVLLRRGLQCQASPPQQEPVDAKKPQIPTQGPEAVKYYSGMLTSGLQQDNGASSADMLKRSLQLAGGIAAVLVALTAGFLVSNGLLG